MKSFTALGEKPFVPVYGCTAEWRAAAERMHEEGVHGFAGQLAQVARKQTEHQRAICARFQRLQEDFDHALMTAFDGELLRVKP
jgi:hypothetical protein